MGTSNTKDQAIQLYVQVERPYYVAGEYVKGCAYLIANATRQYHRLALYFIGHQYVYWEQRRQKKQTQHMRYVNSYENYKCHFQLKEFKGTVPQGQYAFPFSFMLPAMMSGSFFQSNDCFIKYALRLELIHPLTDKKTQAFEININIVEPPRMPLTGVVTNSSYHGKCCGCCKDYGEIRMSMSCDKNFVLNGEQIHVSGIVDNSRCTTSLKNVKVLFQQWIVKVSQIGQTLNFLQMGSTVYEFPEQIEIGEKKEFQCGFIIPQKVCDYTAIGKITARYFILNLVADYGCMRNVASLKLHLIVHSRVPRVIGQMQVPKPTMWNPQYSPEVVCDQMKPFVANPLPQIPFRNLPKTEMGISTGSLPPPAVTADNLYMHGEEMNYYPDLNRYSQYQPNYFNNPYYQDPGLNANYYLNKDEEMEYPIKNPNN